MMGWGWGPSQEGLLPIGWRCCWMEKPPWTQLGNKF